MGLCFSCDDHENSHCHVRDGYGRYYNNYNSCGDYQIHGHHRGVGGHHMKNRHQYNGTYFDNKYPVYPSVYQEQTYAPNNYISPVTQTTYVPPQSINTPSAPKI